MSGDKRGRDNTESDLCSYKDQQSLKASKMCLYDQNYVQMGGSVHALGAGRATL